MCLAQGHNTVTLVRLKPATPQVTALTSCWLVGVLLCINPVSLASIIVVSVFQEIVETITRITHSHTQAIQGAILQCYAVELALRTQKLDTDDFIDELIDKLKPLEEESAKLQKDKESDRDKTEDTKDQGEQADEKADNCDKDKESRYSAIPLQHTTF